MMGGRFFITIEGPGIAISGMNALTRPAFILVVDDTFARFAQYAVFSIEHSG